MKISHHKSLLFIRFPSGQQYLQVEIQFLGKHFNAVSIFAVFYCRYVFAVKYVSARHSGLYKHFYMLSFAKILSLSSCQSISDPIKDVCLLEKVEWKNKCSTVMFPFFADFCYFVISSYLMDSLSLKSEKK